MTEEEIVELREIYNGLMDTCETIAATYPLNKTLLHKIGGDRHRLFKVILRAKENLIQEARAKRDRATVERIRKL